ncbi:MAG: prepilin peptidase [Deltaproteobacteria bacterium]|nr:prepilin peptidase [Deltaproteobacteria bacterium]
MARDPVMMISSLVFGLILGSFLNVCIHRIPLRKSIISPPSSCPQCGNRIKYYDNIPLLSYLILRGKCRYCGQSISLRYPVVELISGLLSLSLFLRYGFSFQYFAFLAFVEALIVLSVIDLRFKIIPDVISLPGIPLGFIVSVISNHMAWEESMIGIVGGGGFFYLVAVIFKGITGKNGLGGGDIKLLAMIGSWMGWKALPFIILISSLSGSVIGSTVLLLSQKGLRVKIPFGPFLSLGCVVYLFFGKEIISCYLNWIS